MTAGHLLAFNLALLAAWASPGPALLVALRATLTHGRRAGLATGLGLALAAAIWTLVALGGLHSVFRVFPVLYVALKLVGAAYLVWIAWKTWANARRPIAQGAAPRGRAFLDGMLVNFGNPKSVLFAAAVLVVIFPPGLSFADKALIFANHLAVETLAYSVLALVMGSGAVARRYLALKVWLDRVAALMLGSLGLRLLTER